MTVVLDHPLKRELVIVEDPYTLTLSPEGLKLVPKGKRNGIELLWRDLVSGEAALAVALNASLERRPVPDRRPTDRTSSDQRAGKLKGAVVRGKRPKTASASAPRVSGGRGQSGSVKRPSTSMITLPRARPRSR